VNPIVDGVALPIAALTPGSVFAAATRGVICVSGYSSGVRDVNGAARDAVFAEYRISQPAPVGAYEVDHLIPLELGGDNTIANLWPQPRGADSTGFPTKDRLENQLHSLVCAGRLGLAVAQRAIAVNWHAAYTVYTGATYAVPATVVPPVKPPPVPTSGQVFANCTAMHASYPHGVGRSGASDHTSGRPVTSFYVSTSLYEANSRSDRDGDGIACEKA